MPVRLSRRLLLCGVSAAALMPLLGAQPANAQVRSFGGNPNVTITAIDTSGGIVASRISGHMPAFVQVSASAIKATGTDWPYEDLEYSWNFGDPNGKEIFTNPVTGARVNANDSQTGPEAVYVYRTPGTYKITLTIRGKNGDSYTTATVSSDFTAIPLNALHYYFDQVNGKDSNNGLHPKQGTGINGPFQSLSKLRSLLGYNRAYHLARGSQWLESLGLLRSLVNLRFDAYGEGADPIINTNSGANSPIWMDNGANGNVGTAVQNIVFSNIHFVISGTCTAESILLAFCSNKDPRSPLTNIYADNCTFESRTKLTRDTVIFNTMTATNSSRAGFWNCTVKNLLDNTGSRNRQGLAAQNWTNWLFVVGGSFEGAGSNPIFDHHIYPIIQNHALFRWIRFGKGPGRNYCINTDWNNTNPGGSPLQYSEFILYDGCRFSGTQYAHDSDDANNDPSKVQWRNEICQNCAFDSLSSGGILAYALYSYTARDNLVWGMENKSGWFGPGNIRAELCSKLSYKLYRNKIYLDRGNNGAVEMAVTQVPFTSPQPLQWTDNIVFDTRTSARIVALKVAENAGSIVDRNQYYAPNASAFNYNGTTPLTFRSWQGLGKNIDPGSKVANPRWIDPGKGNFNT